MAARWLNGRTVSLLMVCSFVINGALSLMHAQRVVRRISDATGLQMQVSVGGVVGGAIAPVVVATLVALLLWTVARLARGKQNPPSFWKILGVSTIVFGALSLLTGLSRLGRF